MENKKIELVRLSDNIEYFIKEYIFKPLQTTFYIDEKKFDAIYDLSLCCSEFLNPACSFTDMQIDMEEAKLGQAVFKEINKIKKIGAPNLVQLNCQLNMQPQSDYEKLDANYLKLLAYVNIKIEPQNEILWQQNCDKRIAELSKNLDETIEYLNVCSEMELNCMSEVFEELSEHFKSQRLIDCVERNIKRFDNLELQEQLKFELYYMKKHL